MKLSRFIQSCIQLWLNATGKKVNLKKYPILDGPLAEDENIGEQFYKEVALRQGLSIQLPEEGGLLTNFNKVLDPKAEFIQHLAPEITEFYEQTARYKMEVWSNWKAPISYAAKLLIKLVSPDMEQLNIPLKALDTSYGMSSSVIHLKNEETVNYACWLRKSVKNNKVVYAGFYSSFKSLEADYEFVKVIFPLPKGNVTVILRAIVMEDGSIKLISDGKKFGGPGYYRLHKNRKGILKAKMIPIKEVIHVFKDKEGLLRTDHYFKWWNITFLQLHYKITLK